MTDEELKALLAGMEQRLIGRINQANESVLNRLGHVELELTSVRNTLHGLYGDAVTSTRRWLDLEARVTKLEKGDGK